MTQLALALDDEEIWRNTAKDAAVGLDLNVECFEHFDEFRVRFKQVTADVILLDWNMPGKSGLEVLEWIRGGPQANVLVIMLTSRGADEDVVTALTSGADDFVSKPCSVPVLAARMRTHLQRREGANGLIPDTTTYGDVVFDSHALSVSRDIPTEPLTEKEFQVARLLFASLNAPIARETLYTKVWGQSELVSSRSLDTHIASLRKKLALRPAHGYKLTPVYGFGYRLETVKA